MPRVAKAPYSVSYLFPAPDKVPGTRGHMGWPAEYVTRVRHVFDTLTNPRARAAFFGRYYQIVGAHPELEGILYNAPPVFNERTLTATEVDGTVVEKWRDPDSAPE